MWILPILQDAIRHVYQRSLLEHKNVVCCVIEGVRAYLYSSL